MDNNDFEKYYNDNYGDNTNSFNNLQNADAQTANHTADESSANDFKASQNDSLTSDEFLSFSSDNANSYDPYASYNTYKENDAFDSTKQNGYNFSEQTPVQKGASDVNVQNQSFNTSAYSYGSNFSTPTQPAVQSTNTQGGYNQVNSYPTAYHTQNQYGAQTQYAQAPPQNKPKKAKKKGGGKAVIAIVLCVLLSGAAGFTGGVCSKFVKTGDTNSNMTINHVDTKIKTTKSEQTELSTSEIAELVSDSVVEITTEVVQTGAFSKQYISSGAGSGVIVAENGYIVTNNHVIDGASKINVTLKNGKAYDAKLVGTDSIIDIALLKIEESGLTAATFGDSDSLEVGDKAVVIGNPLGQLGGTVTDGIISALNRDVVIDDKTMNLMQTNAAINPGNSGGGLFNGQGQLVGVVVAKSSGTEIEGLGFAIPVNDVEDVLEDLKNYGYVRGRVSLGMSLIDISNYATAMMYNVDETGCYVYTVEDGSNAQKAGFKSGDRITAVDSTQVSTVAEVEKAIKNYKVGDTVKFTVVRNNQTGTVSLELEEYKPSSNSSNSGSSNNNQTPNNDDSNSFYDDFFNSIW